jgi:uncharacterized protein GlcG (DUF336 family)
MDKAWIGSINIAINKAFTARSAVGAPSSFMCRAQTHDRRGREDPCIFD